VNGEAITLVEFEAEVTRYISAQEAGESIDEDAARAIVLQDLVNQVLLSQGARELGFAADELLIQERLQRIIDNAGGERQFERWLEQNLYTVESFKEALARSIEAAWMRDRIIAETPIRAEQVHARQILLYTPEDAAQVLADLRTGTEFATLAAVYDPVTGGDLGWFPRKYLTDPELEEAAFSLQPGEYTKVIETAVGYHILQVIERDPARLLDPEALMIWQEQDLQNWIEQRRNQVLIEIFTS
jgi:parvulin-like peptidyl-prolyl isomerase